MNGCAASLPISRARWKARVERIVRRRCARASPPRLLLSAPALAADPSDLESKLTITIGGIEKTLSLEEAKAALNIPSVSLALIDQDSIAFARAYGENATPNTLYQAASLSKFVAAVGAMRLVDQKKLALDETSTPSSPHGRSRPTASTRTTPSPCAAC